jgi:ubiquinone/menaquinone biosynthesis C-methylase UbiE
MSSRRNEGIDQGPVAGSGSVPIFDAFFDDYLAAYSADSLYGYVLRTRRTAVIHLLRGVTGRVLDVGCGPGVMTQEILDLGCEFWGVDGSSRVIGEGRRRFSGCARAHFGVADAVSLPFADATFDGIVCIGVIDRVARPEAVIAELGRVLKPHGTMVMSFGNLLSPYALWRSHVFYVGIGFAKRLAAQFGYSQQKPDLCSAANLWTPRAACSLVEMLVGEVREVTYYNFAILLAPLDELLPGAALQSARWLERLRTSRFRWLGAGFLVKAAKSVVSRRSSSPWRGTARKIA